MSFRPAGGQQMAGAGKVQMGNDHRESTSK